MKSVAVMMLLLVCVAAAPAPSPTVNEVIAGYRKMHRLTDTPYLVGPPIVIICAATPEVKAIMVKHGPHAFLSLHVFMDKLAKESFTNSTPYPVGSVIVKEKEPGEDNSPALGGMIKRKVSTPPSVDDWEFFYSDWDRKLAPEKSLNSCKDCHANAGKTDFVFGDWSKAKQPEPSKP